VRKSTELELRSEMDMGYENVMDWNVYEGGHMLKKYAKQFKTHLSYWSCMRSGLYRVDLHISLNHAG